jgi:cellobiose phosphorylase
MGQEERLQQHLHETKAAWENLTRQIEAAKHDLALVSTVNAGQFVNCRSTI